MAINIIRQNPRSIQLFVAVYEELSFTLAALRENATQSGVSQHVSDLEDSLGVKLFERGAISIQPTPAGRAYYSACLDLLKSHERTINSVEPFKKSSQGEINVGMTPTLTRAVLAPAYERFTKQNPNVIVRVIDSYFGDLIDQVRTGELTFAIVPSSFGSKGVRTTFFAKSPEMLISSSTSPYKHCHPLRLADVAPLELVMPGSNNARRKIIDNYLTSNDIGVKRFVEFDTMAGMIDLVSKGNWSTILPLVMITNDIESGKYKVNQIIDPPLNLETFVIEPARKSMSDVAASFLNCLKEEFRLSIKKANELIKAASH